MGASVSTVAGSAYTWQTATFSWNSSVSQKTWTTAAPNQHTLSADDTLAFSEVAGKGVSKKFSEALSVAELLKKTYGLNESESIAFVELLKKSYGMNESEAISIAEMASKGIGVNESESLSISDLAKRAFSKIHKETLTISETYTDQIQFWIRVFETVTMAEKLGKVLPDLALSDSLTLAEKIVKGIGVNESESIGFTEKLAKTTTSKLAEALSIVETLERTRGIALSDSFAITDKISRNVTKGVKETLAVQELFGRTVAFQKWLTDGFSVSDALKKASMLKKAEAISVFEEFPRNSGAVLSDMIIQTDELTLEKFKEMVDYGHAPGYKPFRDFIPGDYEYQKALFRAVLESNNADRAKITALRIDVDVPDVIDRGSATITDAANGIRVNFNRDFYVVPEVTIITKSSTAFARPVFLVDPDISGFTVALKDGANNFVTGTITWAAHGY